jgi:uncharacterized protein
LNRQLPFGVACVFEVSLLLLVFAWGRLFDSVPLADLRWSTSATLIGLAGAVPPLGFFLWTLRSNLSPLLRHRALMENLMRPMFANWSIRHLATVSALAGICEEALFRGAVQGGLTGRVGTSAALALASLGFGAAHLITWTYGIMAALIGAYLGAIWILTGNLLTPMVTHAVYDFCALIYLLFYHSDPAKT